MYSLLRLLPKGRCVLPSGGPVCWRFLFFVMLATTEAKCLDPSYGVAACWPANSVSPLPLIRQNICIKRSLPQLWFGFQYSSSGKVSPFPGISLKASLFRSCPLDTHSSQLLRPNCSNESGPVWLLGPTSFLDYSVCVWNLPGGG